MNAPLSEQSGPSRQAVEFATAVAILAFAMIVILGSLQAGIEWGAEGPQSGFFPFLTGAAIAISSLVNLTQCARSGSSGIFAEWTQLRQVAAVIVPTGVYVFVIGWLGLYVPSVILITGFMIWLGKYNPFQAMAVAITVMAITFVTFEWWFLVPLPRGPIEAWCGL